MGVLSGNLWRTGLRGGAAIIVRILGSSRLLIQCHELSIGCLGHCNGIKILKLFNLLPKSNLTFAAEAVGRLESEKAAIHAEYEQVGILRTKYFSTPVLL